MGTGPPGLVGRQAELATIERFLRGLRASPSGAGPRILLISGPAGIGKSVLLTAAIARAAELDVRVLAARPAETEGAFAYAALADLLRDAWADLGVVLSRPQLSSLEVAAGLAEQVGEVVDPALVQSAAANGLLRMAAQKPMLVAIDDVAWLDPPSAAAVAFIGRRLSGRPIGLLLAQRAEEHAGLPAALVASAPADAVEHVWLEPLSVGALHRLLDERLGLSLPRPQLIRLHELSAGVPFHALEIGRALQRSPAAAGASLPIPRSLRELLASRTGRLDADQREALLLVAAAGRLALSALAELLGAERARQVVSAAIDEGLMLIEGDLVRAAHPLIASTVYEEAPASRRRAVHARLGELAHEPEARARHRALATLGADESVAAELEEAGRQTLERGAPDTAADLLRLAVERTPAERRSERLGRSLALGDALYRAADLRGAAAVLEALIPQLEKGPPLARAHAIMSEVEWYTGTSRGAVGHVEAGLVAAAGHPDVEAELNYRLTIFFDFDWGRALAPARAAVAALEKLDRPSLLASAMFTLFSAEVGLGFPPDLDLFERALAIEPPDSRDSTTIPGIWWLALDRPDEARRRFEHMLALDRRYGQLSSEASVLTRLAEVELLADRYADTRRLADEATASAGQLGDHTADPARRIRALVDAHEGRLEEAAGVAREGYERTAAAGDHIIAAAWLVVLVFVAASRADHAEVERVTGLSAGHLSAMGAVEPLRLGVQHERLESLAALGRVDEAAALLAQLGQRQAVIPRPWLEAALVRARALLRLAEGDAAGAAVETEPVLDDRAAGWRRLDRGRTLLVRGSVLRRARAPRDGAAALDEALAIFEGLGAAAWAERVREESQRLGRHRPGSDELTPSEARVAVLAASGLTNRQVAERMAVSTKTIEAHLARVYTKLGIHSRAELGRLMADRTRAE